MRCWHPRAENVMNEIKLYNPDEIILMPLYPQYSAATTGSSIKEWNDVCKKNNYKIKTSIICCYPTDKNFINANTKEINKKITDLKNFKLIFSAHGLPEKNIKKGDPYQWQMEQSVNKIIENLENKKDLENSVDEYQKLIKLNILIEKRFQTSSKEISEKTKSKIKDILTKNNEKKTK